MKQPHREKWLVGSAILFLGALACGGTGAPMAAGTGIAPIKLAPELKAIDVCAAIPPDQIEAVMERRLSKAPVRFEYDDAVGSSGCWYEAATDGHDEAHFGYVAFTHLDVYEGQPLHQRQDVFDLGQGSFFNSGADARELWVKVNDDAAMVIAFGDVPREDGSLQLAALILAAIQ